MKRALKLARRGYGTVSPNPMVGAVLVKDQRIIGEGYHRAAGRPHAECEALSRCREDPRESDLYVNLEPCAHTGRTPPCTQAIIRAGIKRVIIAGRDPNPQVNGKGVAQLRQAGIEVTEGVLEKAATRLNEFFFHHIKTQRPFCALKLALTLDGKTADRWGGSKWITHPLARRHVHHLRAGYDAVLTGAQTVRADDPELTVRLVRGRNPYRVVVSSQSHLDSHAKIVQNNQDRKTILLTTAEIPVPTSAYEVIRISSPTHSLTPEQMLDVLAERGFTSVLIEAGHTLSAQFLNSNLLQRIYLFYGPKILGPGQTPFESISPRPIDKAIEIFPLSFRHFGDTMMIEGEPA
ncbi:MAG: bifunctional diaminohydroxyphosphoribosylaminopyrimidine deaminase/5-amino-6-(5-phosphoribosylamino)uracil reductase RibD [Candidatus Delongbacteria bacterium]|nr:bifunctional diaminohydroxyphosphoribosylaminopyrimidine deaminase/5-amino-6-(5-phosphoribosylamino)uracil reductase RibD [Candidatus Delongbacteria bacterium]